MLPFVQRLRDVNGFLKCIVTDYDYAEQLTGGMQKRLSIPLLSKAVDATEWSTKCVSNKIKIVAVLYNLTYESYTTSFNDQYSLEWPIAIDMLRMTQSIPDENTTRSTGDNWYLKKHAFNNPSVVNGGNPVITLGSMFNFPFDTPEKGYVKFYQRNQSSGAVQPVLKYNSENLTALLRHKKVQLSTHQQVDCVVEIPDDGNPNTVINLRQCVGEIPELIFLSVYMRRAALSPFALQHNFYLTGQVMFVYQDIGTKLSHL